MDENEKPDKRVKDFRVDATPQEFFERLLSGGAPRREEESEGGDAEDES